MADHDQDNLPVHLGTNQTATGSGLIDLVRLRYTAWWTEHVSRAELRILEWRGRLFAERANLVEFEYLARNRVAGAATEAADQEAELHLRERLRHASASEGHAILGADIVTQRLLVEREYLRHHRANAMLPPAPQPVVRRITGLEKPPIALPPDPPEPEEEGAFELEVSNRQIERLALRAVTRMSRLTRAEAIRAWSAWREELDRRLPRYAAEEVAHRADELRTLMEER